MRERNASTSRHKSNRRKNFSVPAPEGGQRWIRTTEGLVRLNATGKVPVINGVLTVNNEQQALDRAGEKMNKGREFAMTAVKMVQFIQSFE